MSFLRKAALPALSSFLLSAAILFNGPASAATTTLHVGDKILRPATLQPGVRRYLRYTVKDGGRSTLDIWSREIRFDVVNRRRLLHITQRWDGVAANVYTRYQESVFDAETFQPITHRSEVVRNGESKLSAFRFLEDKVVGDDNVLRNAHKGFTAAMEEPAYNFETDMELLESLPLSAGFEVSIPFYDPGLKPAARYVFKVAGEATIPGADGTPIECWLVTADYNKPDRLARFWFSKRSHLMIRYETNLTDGGLLIKTLLSAESADQ